jgi:hypothetical protein
MKEYDERVKPKRSLQKDDKENAAKHSADELGNA